MSLSECQGWRQSSKLPVPITSDFLLLKTGESDPANENLQKAKATDYRNAVYRFRYDRSFQSLVRKGVGNNVAEMFLIYVFMKLAVENLSCGIWCWRCTFSNEKEGNGSTM